jgi:hypothetical protein
MVGGWGIAFYTLNFWHLDFLTPDSNPESIFYLRAFRDMGLALDAVALVGPTGSLLI